MACLTFGYNMFDHSVALQCVARDFPYRLQGLSPLTFPQQMKKINSVIVADGTHNRKLTSPHHVEAGWIMTVSVNSVVVIPLSRTIMGEDSVIACSGDGWVGG